MTTLIAYRIATYMCKKNSIEKDEIDIYQYGLEIVLDTLLNTILLLILGIISGDIIHTIVFIVVFASLRMYAGGYHANTKLKCTVCTLLVYIVNVIICNIRNLKFGFVLFICYLVGTVIIVIKAPVLTPNKELSHEKLRNSKLISILLCIVCMLSVLILNVRASHYSKEIEVLIFEISILMLMQRREINVEKVRTD